MKECPMCKGKGTAKSGNECPACNGECKVSTERFKELQGILQKIYKVNNKKNTWAIC